MRPNSRRNEHPCAQIAASILAMVALTPACTGGSGAPGDAADSAAVTDASLRDANGSCGWELVSLPTVSVELLDVTPVHPERTARLVVTARQCPGDEPAPVFSSPTLENEYLWVVAQAWRRRDAGECANPELVERPVDVRFLYPGGWKIIGEQATLTVTVVSAPAGSCAPTAGECDRDCDCEPGESCLSFMATGGPTSACARSCEVNRDCLGDGVCGTLASGLSGACDDCVPECVGASECPGGFDCEAQECQPQFTLNADSRHPCTCDEECDSPLRCVWQFGATMGRCEMVCHTGSDGWCEGAHSCDPGASVESAPAVCGWVGE